MRNGINLIQPLSIRPRRTGGDPLGDPQPLFTPDAGRRISLIVIAMFAASTFTLLVKLFTRSRWVDAVSSVVSLALFGLLLRQPFDNLFAVSIPEQFLPKIKFGVKFLLLFIAVMITIDLIKNLVTIGRRKLETKISVDKRGTRSI